MADKTGAPPKERRLYKGTTATLKELDGQHWVIAQVVDRNTGKRVLPNFVVVETTLPSYIGRNHRTVVTLDPRAGFRRDNFELPETTQLNVLTGRMGAELRAEFEGWQMKNLSTAVPKVSMKLGADPEMFVEDKDGTVIPAFKFLGSKAEPTTHANRTGHPNHVYWDGFQAEFDLVPDTCLAWVMDRLQAGLQGLHLSAKAHSRKARISAKTVLPVPMEMLESAQDEHVEFGCAPSMNVYGLEGRKVPGRQLPVRFAGGHIHFGFNSFMGIQPQGKIDQVVKALDAILGVASVSLFAEFDNPVRREFYGLPGEYRLPKHGMEYRTLSNAWLFHPLIANLVLDTSRRALAFGWAGIKAWKAEEAETIDVIKNSDVKRAREILTRNKAIFEGLMDGVYYGSSDTAFKVFLNGMESAVTDPTDIVGNWCLDKDWLSHCETPGKNWRTSWPMLSTGKKVK